MSDNSDNYHEPYEVLSEETRNMHRALVSLMEELEAIDWYQQRADACTDGELREILLHNKREEMEHAMMTLEWIRRRDADFDRMSRTYLYTEGPITGIEEHDTEGETGGGGGTQSLGLGGLEREKGES